MPSRSVDDPARAVGGLRKQLDDHRSTTNARITRRPTGTIEPTFATTAKAGTLMCDGQDVLRADYPVLWQWVQDSGALSSGAFDNGNNSTTFGLPDLRNQITTVGTGIPLNFIVWT